MATEPLRCAVLGTDTGVGKTLVTALLVRALRAVGRRVWVHKPVACGDWLDGQAEDGRRLAPLVGDGQDPATCCPAQFPVAAAPSLAASLAGARLTAADMLERVRGLCRGGHDLVLEGAGGVLAPLGTDRSSIVDLLQQEPFDCLVVTRPHLGTLNHSALTVRCLQAAGLRVRGLIVNEHEPVDQAEPAIATARDELTIACGVPVLAWLAHRPDQTACQQQGAALVRALGPVEVGA